MAVKRNRGVFAIILIHCLFFLSAYGRKLIFLSFYTLCSECLFHTGALGTRNFQFDNKKHCSDKLNIISSILHIKCKSDVFASFSKIKMKFVLKKAVIVTALLKLYLFKDLSDNSSHDSYYDLKSSMNLNLYFSPFDFHSSSRLNVFLAG